MIEKCDYTKYLSVDNGSGVLLNENDVAVLKKYGIDWSFCSSIKELIFVIGLYIDESYEEDLDDLEDVLCHLMEVHYYCETNK